MILYRARTIASRPARAPAHMGNEPAIRIRGRWFTSSLELAREHAAGLRGAYEIVAVEVPDEIADTHRVATTPVTRCGLEPDAHTTQADTDHVLPMFRVVQARTIHTGRMGGSVGGRIERLIDVIDVRTMPGRSDNVVPLPLAA